MAVPARRPVKDADGTLAVAIRPQLHPRWI